MNRITKDHKTHSFLTKLFQYSYISKLVCCVSSAVCLIQHGENPLFYPHKIDIELHKRHRNHTHSMI